MLSVFLTQMESCLSPGLTNENKWGHRAVCEMGLGHREGSGSVFSDFYR